MFLYLSILCLVFLFSGSGIIADILTLPNLLKLIEYDIIEHLDVGSLHTGRTGLDNTCTLEFAERIYDHGSGDSHTVCDLARNQDSLFAIQLVKDMDNRFQFGELQSVEG